jgi:hypothetical protein
MDTVYNIGLILVLSYGYYAITQTHCICQDRILWYHKKFEQTKGAVEDAKVFIIPSDFDEVMIMTYVLVN